MEGNVRMFRAKIQSGEMTEQEAEAILGKSVWEAQGKIPASWATPTASDHIERKSTQQTPGSMHSVSLPDAVKMWPTPRVAGSGEDIAKIQERFRQGLKYKARLEEAVAQYPTMSALGMGNTGSRQKLQKLVDDGSLTDAEKRGMTAGNGGKLNPTWVEWLMGFPLGWTDLEDSETL
jgi:hypothetical protein